MAPPAKKDIHGLVGKTVSGRYHVNEVIGVGGMGVVYRAHQAAVDRDVAIKVLMPEMISDETLIKRFELEARAASRLSHPNTITVYDFGREGDLLYIAMEFLDGESIEQKLRRDGAMKSERVAKVIVQVLSSLAEAHKKGIVHRDIKPDNIFMQSIEHQKDFVKVLDFGVAKLKDPSVQDVTLTQAGIIFGTPKYMSPEQAKAKKLDGRSDQYSLGVVMWEMLMGDVPFKAEDPVSILIQHVHDPPAYFRDVRPDLQVPEEVEVICRKAMEKDRENRYETAEEMRTALEDYIARAKAGEYGTSAQRAVQSSQQVPEVGVGTGHAAPVHSGQYAPNATPPGVPDSVSSSPRAEQQAPGGIHDTWGVDGNQFDLAEHPPTRMVRVGQSGNQSSLLAAVFILGLLLLCGVGFLIWKMSEEPVNDPDIVAEGDVEQDGATPPPDTAGNPDSAPDTPPIEVAEGDWAPDESSENDTAPAEVAEPGDTAQPDSPEEVVAATTWVQVRLVSERPESGVRYDFDGREFEEVPDQSNLYRVNLADGETLEVRARASGYRSKSLRIDLSEAGADGIVTETFRLRERSGGGDTTDPCIDPVTGFRDPYCR